MCKPPSLCSIWLWLLALAVASPGCSREAERTAADQSVTNAPALIVPHMSVGQIKAHMTMQQVVGAVGEPRNKTANAWDYPQLGLAVMPKDGVVLAVLCGDVTGINGSYVKVFSGRTKEGIGLRSTRDEVLKAYGPPTETQGKPGGLESLKYVNIGITFNLEGGKVHHMIVLLDGNENSTPSETDNTIKLNLGTPGDSGEKR